MVIPAEHTSLLSVSLPALPGWTSGAAFLDAALKFLGWIFFLHFYNIFFFTISNTSGSMLNYLFAVLVQGAWSI